MEKTMQKKNEKHYEINGPKRLITAAILGVFISTLNPVALYAEPDTPSISFISATNVKEETVEELITVEKGGTITLGEASIEIPEGALKEDTRISITKLAKVAETGESLYNAIPSSGGYRFLPAGTQFQKEVTVTLPYNPALNSKPQSLDELYTYFYDTQKKSWIKLERIEIDTSNCLVRSRTTHFTDMINATLTLPESASPVDINLNSIKNLEAAKPDSHLIKFNPPKASNMGDATFSFDLDIPTGRQGMEPQLTVTYSSGAGNGIMGKGFDINYGSSITTDTRNSLPKYDTEDTYMLDGILLGNPVRSQSANKLCITYTPLKETSFNRIRRYIDSEDNDWWEVTDKNGTTRTYGKTENSCVGSGNKIFTWNLTKIEDIHKNNIIYNYVKHEDYVYPSEIIYTGFDNITGQYYINFDYDKTRKDIRIDARSGQMISCNWLLKEITTKYAGSNDFIRKYIFDYDESLTYEKMLKRLCVRNNDYYKQENDKEKNEYCYTFKYEEPKKNDDDSLNLFAKADLWQKFGHAVNESYTTNKGSNVSVSGGVGVGFANTDVRVTGGLTSNSGNSQGYTSSTLIDINGDGKVDNVVQSGDSILVYLNTGTGFSSSADDENTINQAVINKSEGSNYSDGWNAYGGAGSRINLAAGYSYSKVKQKSSSMLTSGFYDVDGDGLTDIITSPETYLHNDGNISFSLKQITGIPLVSGSKDYDLKELNTVYPMQRPFRAWKAPYYGTIDIDISGRDASSLLVYDENEVINTSVSKALQEGSYLYFIPQGEDLREGVNSEHKIVINYKTIQPFKYRNDNFTYYLPPSISQLPNTPVDDLYNPIKNDDGEIINYKLIENLAFTLNNKYMDDQTRYNTITDSIVLPSEISELDFTTKIANTNINTKKLMTSKYVFDAATKTYRLTTTNLSETDKKQIKETFGNINRANYKKADIKPFVVMTGDTFTTEYKDTSGAISLDPTRNYSTPGSVFPISEGFKIYIGEELGNDFIDSIVINGTNYNIITRYGKYSLTSLDNTKGIELFLSDNESKYNISLKLSDIDYKASYLTELEYNTIISKERTVYDYKSLDELLDLKSVDTGKTEKMVKDFLTEYETSEHVDSYFDAIYEKKSPESKKYKLKEELTDEEKTLAAAFCDSFSTNYFIKEEFPYYQRIENAGDFCYKLTTTHGGNGEDYLIKICQDYKLYKYNKIVRTINYSKEGSYNLDSNGNYSILKLNSSNTFELKTIHVESFSFDSYADFSTKTYELPVIGSYTHTITNSSGQEETENIDIQVTSEDVLYGGNKNWFYGIWNGLHEYNAFSPQKLLLIDNDEVQEYTKLSEEDVNNTINAGPESKASVIKDAEKPESLKKDSVPLDYYLPVNENANLLEGNTSTGYESVMTDNSGSPEVVKREITSFPYITPEGIRCERLGLFSYYDITADSKTKSLTRTLSSATDITNGPSGSAIIFSLSYTDNKNDGTSYMMQTLQDIDGDRVLDLLICDENGMAVYKGSLDDSKNLSFENTNTTIEDITEITYNDNHTTGNCVSFDINGAVSLILKASGAPKGLSLSNGIGDTNSSGTSEMIHGFIDINGDGLNDYIKGNSILYGVGNQFANYNKNQFTTENISKSSIEASAFSLSLGTGYGSSDSNITPYTQDEDGNPTNSSYIGCSGTISVSGSESSSDTYTTSMFLDINGDGLPDRISADGNGNFKVYLNVGNTFKKEPLIISGTEWDISKDITPKYDGGFDSSVLNGLTFGKKKIIAKTDKKTVSLETILKYASYPEYNRSNTLSLSGTGGLNINAGIPLFFCKINITGNVSGGPSFSATQDMVTVKMMDLDGDGLQDHVMRIPGIGTYWKQNLGGKFGLLNGITLPQGGNIEIDYTPKYGDTNNPNFKYVMSRVTINDGCSDTNSPLPYIDHGSHSITTLYTYKNGYYDRNLKDFYGYSSVTTTYSDGTKQIDIYKNKNYYLKGCLSSSTLYSPDEKELSQTNISYCAAPYALPKTEESITYEKNINNVESISSIKTVTQYEYDYEFGNCTNITQDLANGQKLTAEIKYVDPDRINYIVSLPFYICVTDTNGKTLRYREGNYENGQLINLKQYYNLTSYTENTLSYDKYGNIESIKDSRNAKLFYTYDEATNTFVNSITQSGDGIEGYIDTIQYDPATQTKIIETDCNSNTLRYEYDNWQRITKIFTSYDGKIPAVQYDYHSVNKKDNGTKQLWYTITSNKVTFDKDDNSVIDTVLQIDGLGRTVRTAKTGFVNEELGWNVSGAVKYDLKGRIEQEGMTEFIKGDLDTLLKSTPVMTQLTTSYLYDHKDRQIKTILPDGSIQTNAFFIKDKNFVTETTDPNGNISVQETDASGNIVRVAKLKPGRVQLTEVTYLYNEMGEMLKAFDAKGNPISVEYDLLGRRTALESLDNGRQEFFYDNSSNLIRETNSVLREQNKQIKYEYDGLNRLIHIDYPYTQDTYYTYGDKDAPNKAAGKVLSVTDASGTIEYVYGSLGEVTKETRTLKTHLNSLNDTDTAVMEYRSDYLGRMQWIKYPDEEEITYEYDKGGQVTKVTGEHWGTDFVYVNKIKYDKYGQRTYIEYGNGTHTSYTYNEERRWLDSITTQGSQNQYYQNISYEFDKVGNVRKYQNNCLDGVFGNYKTEQSYEYDELYQLTKVNGDTTYNPYSAPVPEHISTYEQIFTFDQDGLGNMTRKLSSNTISSDMVIGDNLNYDINYTYDPSYAHRIINAGNRYYKYDSNGNIICEQDGPFEGEGPVTYRKITQETQDVYSTEYAWGLFNENTNSHGNSGSLQYRRTYTWDEKNQLISSVDDNYSTSYVYGQDGQRTNKYTSSSETLYFNKMWTLHTDSGNSSTGGQYSKNIYLGDTRIVTKLRGARETTTYEEINKQYFYHSDHLGSASLITDINGNEYQRIEYTPYGETWVEKTQNNGLEYLPYKFTAKEQDEETGLYYYGARYLDPKYSMWISTDPALGDYIPQAPVSDQARQNNQNLPGMGGIFNHINGNLYAYAANNPVRYIDPDGNAIAHFSPFGWSHDAPQRIFGYFNIYDFLSIFLGFAIDGTRINGNDFTIRLWKGNYGLSGAGCEIGLYTANGRALSKKELEDKGLISSIVTLKDEKGNTLGTQNEDKPSFWTTIFKPFHFKKRKNLNAHYILTFKDEQSANDFFNQIGGEYKEDEAENYYWNRDNDVQIRKNGNEIILDYN